MPGPTSQPRALACQVQKDLQQFKLMNDPQMLADVRAYDAAKARLDHGDDELIPLKLPSAAAPVKTRFESGVIIAR